MNKLRNLLVFLSAFGVAFTAYAATPQNNPAKDVSVTIAHHHQNKTDAVVNLNAADAQQLQTVKYIGSKKAQAIVEYRSQHGNYKSLDELLKVKCRGINQKWLDKVKSRLTI